MTQNNFSTQNIEGVDVTVVYTGYNQANAQTSTNTPEYPGPTGQFSLGQIISGNNGSKWIYCTTNTTIPNGSVVVIDKAFNAVLGGGTGGLAADTFGGAVNIGFYQNATSMTTGQYAWFMIQGLPTVLVAGAATLPTTALYSSDTAGSLTGVTNTVSHYAIFGISVTVTASGTTASLTLCVANNPLVRKPGIGG
jgi:hypothetical protein